MFRGNRVAVVVPCHNEEAHIAQVILTMPDYVDHVIVVDDASNDATAARAKATGDPRVEVIALTENGGVGAAVLTGHQRALAADADIAVVMAGDGQMDPLYLPDLLDPIVDGQAQFTKANRFFSAHSFRGMPRSRIFGNIVLSFLTKAASGYWNLFDPQNGYTAIHRSALERVPLESVARRYDFENDLLIHLNILRVQAKDVPIPARYGDEVSGMRVHSVAGRILGRLVAGFWRRIVWKYVLNSFSPVAVMLFGGLALLLIGMFVGVFVVINTLGEPIASPATVLLCVAPLLTGFHLLLFAWMLDIQEASL